MSRDRIAILTALFVVITVGVVAGVLGVAVDRAAQESSPGAPLPTATSVTVPDGGSADEIPTGLMDGPANVVTFRGVAPHRALGTAYIFMVVAVLIAVLPAIVIGAVVGRHATIRRERAQRERLRTVQARRDPGPVDWRRTIASIEADDEGGSVGDPPAH